MRVWKVILAALVIFAAGVVTGALGYRLAVPSPPARSSGPPKPSPEAEPVEWWRKRRVEYLDRLDERLSLSAEQRAAIEEILEQSHQRMKELWDTIGPKAREESRSVRQQIEALLSPDQRAEFEEFSRFREGHKHGGRFDRGEHKRGPRRPDRSPPRDRGQPPPGAPESANDAPPQDEPGRD